MEAVECAETKVRHQKVDGAQLDDGTGSGKLRHVSHVGEAGNSLIEERSEHSVRFNK